MANGFIEMPIEELHRLHGKNQRIMDLLTHAHSVIPRFQRRPEQYLYFFHSNGELSMTPVDIDRPIRGLRPITLGRLRGLDEVVSGCSGLLVRVFTNQHVLAVCNPLVGNTRDRPLTETIPFPSQLKAANPIGPVQIFVNEANATYVIWFYVYRRYDKEADGKTGMFVFDSETRLWTHLAGPGNRCPLVDDDLVIDRDVSASLFEPGDGQYSFKYEAGAVYHSVIARADLPTGYERVDGCFAGYSHFAVIGGTTWAFQTETVRSVSTGQLQEFCFLSTLDRDWSVAAMDSHNGPRRMRWTIMHTVDDAELLGLIFDTDDTDRSVDPSDISVFDRIVVTADTEYFFVCARNDSRVFRLNPLTGLGEVVVGNGVIPNPRENVFAMPASFILP